MTRVHVSLACQACKQGKKKARSGLSSFLCTGETPCSFCVKRAIECVYDESGDGRRQISRKRKADEQEADSHLLHDILQTVRDCSDESVAQIVSLARSNASLEEAKLCISEMLHEIRQRQRKPSPELEFIQRGLEGYPGQSRRHAFTVDRLTDQPPLQMQAAPWTTVTQDNMLVSNLVSVWLIWQNTFYNWIHEETFLQDMKSGDPSACYCSPFLVNAVLGGACLYSDYDEARAQHGLRSPLMTAFIEEASRLFRDMPEAEKSTIPTIQGLVSLWLAISLTEGDGVNKRYLSEAVARCEKLVEDPVAAKQGLAAEVLDVTAWGVYSMLVTLANFWQTPVGMRAPDRSMPDSRAADYHLSLYPLDLVAKPQYSRALLRCRSELAVLQHKFNTLLFSDEGIELDQERKETKLKELQRETEEHEQKLPENLRVSSDASPSILLHQSNHHLFKMKLADHILRNSNSASTISRALRERQAAAMEIVHMVRVYTSCYDNKHVNPYWALILLTSLLTLLEEPPSEATGEVAFPEDILELCIFFRALSRRVPWVMVALRMFQEVARQRQQRLPASAISLFEDFEKEEWDRRANCKMISQNVAPTEGKRPDNEPMNDFLERLDQLNVQDEAARPAPSAMGPVRDCEAS